MQGQGNFIIRPCTAQMIKLGLEGRNRRRRRAAQGVAVFPFHHSAGFQDIGQGRGHMPDLVARGLAVPAEDRLIKQRTRRVGQAHRLVQGAVQWQGPVRQPQKPIGRHPQRRGRLGHALGVGQACAGGQKRGKGGSVHPHRPRQRALALAAGRHGQRQPAAEQRRTVAFICHLVTFQNICDFVLRNL